MREAQEATTDTEMQRSVAATRAASRRMVRQLGLLERRWSPTALRSSECHLLLEIGSHGRLAIHEAAELLNLDASTAGRVAAGLESKGLLDVAPDEQDRRRKVLTLTGAGREKVAQIDRAADAQVARALRLLSDQERSRVAEALDTYSTALERARRLASIAIEPIRPEDDAAVQRIIQTVMPEFGAVGEGYAIVDPEVSQMSTAYGQPGHAYFVARREGAVLGGAGVGPLAGGEDGVCELRKMYVLPEGRGFRLGQRLLERCLDAARSLGYRVCYLETLKNMTQARRLYERNGFRPLAGPRGATGHFGCDAWYALELAPETEGK